MNSNYFICLFLILIFEIYSKTNNDDENNKNKKEPKSFAFFEKNPYHIFKIAPWKSFSIFEKKYIELKNELIYDSYYSFEEKKEKLLELERAFLKIKEKHEKNVNNILIISMNVIIKIITYIALAYIFNIGIFIFHKLQGRGSDTRYQIITSVIISKFFPHYFESQSNQYIVSLISGIMLRKFVNNLLNKIKCFFGEKNKGGNKINNNENNNNFKNFNPNFNYNQIFKSMPLQNEPYPKFVYNMDNIQQDKNIINENMNNNTEMSYYDNKRILNEIKVKILSDLHKKGWTGMRQFKMYLRSLKNYTTDYIEKTEFKYYSYKFGLISLNDNDFDVIYQNFDHKCNNTINFIEFLNSLHFNNEDRKKLIYTLLKSMKMKNNYVSYIDVQSKIDMNQHPEVLRYEKNKDQVAYEYNSTWDNLKEDNLIPVDNFIEYFEDISCMYDNDREFKQCLASLGLKL